MELVSINDLAKELGLTRQAIVYQVEMARKAFPQDFKITKRISGKPPRKHSFLEPVDAKRLKKYYHAISFLRGK